MLHSTATIPQVPGDRLLGHARQLNGDLQSFLVDCYRSHGPVFGLRALSRRFTVIAGLEANTWMTSRSRTLLRSHEFWHPMDKQLQVPDQMTSVDGPRHRHLRRQFQYGVSRELFDERLPEAGQVLQEQLRRTRVGADIIVPLVTRELAARQIARISADLADPQGLDDVSAFVTTALESAVLKARSPLALYSPRYRLARRRALALGRSVVAQHEQAPGRRDLVTDLLDSRRREPEATQEHDVLAAAMGVFIAGLDTVGSTLAYLLHDVISRPQVLAAVRAEIDPVLGSGQVRAQELREAHYLNAVVSESLRLHPIAPAQSRHVTQDFEFAGHTIPAGSSLLVATTVPHQLAEVFPEPTRFVPERFLPPRNEQRTAGAYSPFGRGPHICLGSNMAEGMLATNLALLVHCLDLALPDGYRLTERFSPTPRPTADLRLRVLGRRAPFPQFARTEPAQ